MNNSQYTYARMVKHEASMAHRWLDIGCGHAVVPDWTSMAGEFHPDAGVDLDYHAVARNAHVRWRLLASGEALPFALASFDLITANMVLEHVAVPAQLFKEVARVLAPGGLFIAHTPRAFGYTTLLARAVPSSLRPALAKLLQGRAEEDVYPTYYRANSTRALRALAAGVGLTADVQSLSTSPQLGRVPVLGAIEHLFMKMFSPEPCLLCRFTRINH
jgi:SAM-dependent methyltransferase